MGDLITPEYLAMNKAMHAVGNYGIGGWKRAKEVMHLAIELDAKTILDYGCGQGKLRQQCTLPIREYDPAIPGKDSLPKPADLVVCSDVLEHVEPECLDAVLEHLEALTLKACYAVVHLTPAKKTLPDGRNAHLIQQDDSWWEKKLAAHFVVRHVATLQDATPGRDAKEAAYVLLKKEKL